MRANTKIEASTLRVNTKIEASALRVNTKIEASALRVNTKRLISFIDHVLLYHRRWMNMNHDEFDTRPTCCPSSHAKVMLGAHFLEHSSSKNPKELLSKRHDCSPISLASLYKRTDKPNIIYRPNLAGVKIEFLFFFLCLTLLD